MIEMPADVLSVLDDVFVTDDDEEVTAYADCYLAIRQDLDGSGNGDSLVTYSARCTRERALRVMTDFDSRVGAERREQIWDALCRGVSIVRPQRR